MPTDSREPLAQALRIGTPAGIAYTAVATLIGHFVAGSFGSFGAMMGGLVPLVFFGITMLTGVLARRLSPGMLGFAILGSWLPKMLILLFFLNWISDQTWYDRGVFMVSLLVGSIGLLALEGWVVTRTPQTYVDPR